MIRKAKLKDSQEILKIITFWAKKGKVLERSLNYIYENLRNFWVFIDNEEIIGCCALGVVGWDSLGEVKSLGIVEKYQGQGIGKKLVIKCVEEASELGLEKVFALTYVPDFFINLGFEKCDRKDLPHKVWSDCIHCVHFPDCQEVEVILKLK
ncbi:MAG: N-acetyltransferase [Candidatus Omnitrophica bacterium]|nr:N-acetyltransferase [Candidatus Omnitrophota bacterium]